MLGVTAKKVVLTIYTVMYFLDYAHMKIGIAKQLYFRKYRQKEYDFLNKTSINKVLITSVSIIEIILNLSSFFFLYIRSQE